jgi:dimethylglycine dehydrogenase
LEQRDYYSFRRPEWHDVVAKEMKAVRSAAGIMDISAFHQGRGVRPGCRSALDRLVANKLPQKGWRHRA